MEVGGGGRQRERPELSVPRQWGRSATGVHRARSFTVASHLDTQRRLVAVPQNADPLVVGLVKRDLSKKDAASPSCHSIRRRRNPRQLLW
jgi:hypothetical protein